jgi:hypothetical protein
MADFDLTKIDNGSVELKNGEFRDEVYNFSGADELAAGTILARHTGTLKLQKYVKGGSSNGNGTPVAVLTYAVSKDGSGDVAMRPLIHGCVNKNRLVIDADGDASNVDATVLDLLAKTGIVAEDVEQLPQDEPELS